MKWTLIFQTAHDYHHESYNQRSTATSYGPTMYLPWDGKADFESLFRKAVPKAFQKHPTHEFNHRIVIKKIIMGEEESSIVLNIEEKVIKTGPT